MLKKTDGTYFEGEKESEKPSVAIIGAGFGGLSAAMLLSEKGYHVKVFDRLQTVGGRGSSKSQDGHRFDLGPTILTLPKNFEELWKRCGDDLNKHIKIEKLNPYYDLRFDDNTVVSISGNKSELKIKSKSLHQMISRGIGSSCVCRKDNIISRFQNRARWEEVPCTDYGIL